MSDWQAGPELDAEIALRVFGYETHEHHDDAVTYDSIGGWRTQCRRCGVYRGFYDPSRPEVQPQPWGPCRGNADGEDDSYTEYSTTWDAAGLVVEKMIERGFLVELYLGGTDEYKNVCVMHGPGKMTARAFADTPALAICRTAWAVLGCAE